MMVGQDLVMISIKKIMIEYLIKKNKTSMTEDWISGYNKWKENPVAQEVRTPKYKLQVVKAKKGKGSYDRKQHDDG